MKKGGPGRAALVISRSRLESVVEPADAIVGHRLLDRDFPVGVQGAVVASGAKERVAVLCDKLLLRVPSKDHTRSSMET